MMALEFKPCWKSGNAADIPIRHPSIGLGHCISACGALAFLLPISTVQADAGTVRAIARDGQTNVGEASSKNLPRRLEQTE